MPASIRTLAGDCTVVYDGADREEHRGRVVVVVKPDNTVLVHDADGYQPVAWLTRADAVSCSRESDPAVVASTDDASLRVAVHDETGFEAHPAGHAGTPLGDCPDCPGDGVLVRARGDVSCTACERSHGLPRDATVRGDRCSCGLPRIRVERGRAFDLCLDRGCDPIDEAVREAFDREWDCPDCGSPLRVVRKGGLLAGCDAFPACDTAFAIPNGTVVDDCPCGLPAFETASGRRCLDATCDRYRSLESGGGGRVNAESSR